MALIMGSLSAVGANAQAVATPFVVQAGTISNFVVSPDGFTTTITQTSSRAVLDWQQFSVESGKTLAFSQPNASAITLNRVVAGGPATVIDGAITANGKVWILNSNGVYVSPTGSVTTSGFLASTGSINTTDFMNAASRIAITGVTNASIANHGRITVNASTNTGYAVLAGTRVENGQSFISGAAATDGHALISADLNKVVLGSGTAFTLDFSGDRLIFFAIAEGLPSGPNSGGVFNTGTLSAAGGTIVMTGRAAADAVGAVINTSGMVMAQSVGVRFGQVVLDAGPGGRIAVSGSVQAQGLAASSIRLTGNVELTGPATFQTDGTLLIQGPVTAAATTGLSGPNLLVNGGFDSGDLSGWNNENSGRSFAWFVDGATHFDLGPFNGTSFASTGCLFTSCTLSQVFNTTLGANYRLSFAFNPGDNASAGQASASALFNGASLFSQNIGLGPNAWTVYTADITATSSTSTLSFQAFQNPAFSGLDEVYFGLRSVVPSLSIQSRQLIAGAITLPSASVSLQISGTGTIMGPVAANVLSKSGAGLLRLGGSSNQIAQLNLFGGILVAGDTAAVANAPILMDGGILRVEASAPATLSNPITVSSYGEIQLVGPFDWTVTSAIDAAGGQLNTKFSVNAEGNLLFNGVVGNINRLGSFKTLANGRLMLGAGAQISTSGLSGVPGPADFAIGLGGSAGFANESLASLPLDPGQSRWLIWSGNPDPFSVQSGDRLGALAYDFRHYDISLAQARGDAPPPEMLPAGNGLLFSIAPTLALLSGRPIIKVYDGTDTASLVDFEIGFAGTVNGDVAVLSTGPVRFDRSDVLAATLLLPDLTYSVADSLGKPVLGYRFVLLAGGGLPASITPRALSLALVGSVDKVYDGLAAIGLAAANISLTGMVAGEAITVTRTAASLADPNVGSSRLTTLTLGL
ncbi:filamentous hemagglutinin N-terminal domain-containing protein, partial [Sandarakinorhabdus sp.]|uniref:two-partner secretion domain-containing protein n=1 Tax=Sandarakinorhabdus sp. TaxID=1916663 RepID=UPI003564E174